MPWGVAAAAVVGAVASDRSSKKAAEAQKESSSESIRATEKATKQAREDLFKLFPAAQENLAGGFQGALDMFSQSLPAQTNVFQQGNVGAQQQLLAGLPMMQNAILGGPIDYSQLQPTQINMPDMSFFQQQLPQYIDPYAQQSQQQNQTQQQNQQPQNTLAGILGNSSMPGYKANSLQALLGRLR